MNENFSMTVEEAGLGAISDLTKSSAFFEIPFNFIALERSSLVQFIDFGFLVLCHLRMIPIWAIVNFPVN